MQKAKRDKAEHCGAKIELVISVRVIIFSTQEV